ncbi:hypothetical protein TSMEX_005958 [Taenia solium]|eukprot:TsM_000236200 transcript=TsM_000236200 gene=TsM_000236200
MAQFFASDKTPVHIGSEDELPMARASQIMDPRYLTRRSQLDKKKSDIYPEIKKSVLLKEGAQNMLHADARANLFTKAHKTEIEGVLEVESAAICTLKDKMDSLNSEFSTYQKLGTEQSKP